jgi:hypothetical protein
MPLRRALYVAVWLAVGVATGPVDAQTPTAPQLLKGVVPPPPVAFHHHKKLQASSDSVADSTHLSVRTHKGKYFLTMQRPRLTWSVVYSGQRPDSLAPSEVWLEFRTQSPQVALDSRLVVLYGNGERIEVPSAGAHSDPGVVTWCDFMKFPIPTPGLTAALHSQQVQVTVGGITERLAPDHLEALRDLLSRVGAYPGTDWPEGS